MHNEILRRSPHLAEALAGPDWYYDRKGEVCVCVGGVFTGKGEGVEVGCLFFWGGGEGVYIMRS